MVLMIVPSMFGMRESPFGESLLNYSDMDPKGDFSGVHRTQRLRSEQTLEAASARWRRRFWLCLCNNGRKW